MTTNLVYIETDNVLVLDELKDTTDDSYVTTATVQATMKDSAGNEVSGQTWPLTMSYVAGSNAKYRGILDDGLSLTEYAHYVVEIVATASGGVQGKWFFELQALKQRS